MIAIYELCKKIHLLGSMFMALVAMVYTALIDFLQLLAQAIADVTGEYLDPNKTVQKIEIKTETEEGQD